MKYNKQMFFNVQCD